MAKQEEPKIDLKAMITSATDSVKHATTQRELFTVADKESIALIGAGVEAADLDKLTSVINTRMMVLRKNVPGPMPRFELGRYIAPTPPIGLSVQWFQGLDRLEPVAAVITEVNGPGRVCLTLFRKRRQLGYKDGVRHCASPELCDKDTYTLRNDGCWDFLPGFGIPDEYYEASRRAVSERIARVFESARQLQAEGDNYQKVIEASKSVQQQLSTQPA